ncbi:PEPxxWA-CTERM sorting domain-containing protein [Sphingomonas ginsengisoli (ex An et al. 2013)]|nr:PEPxxWA-CTERM sorting domain-containing protein [Sphingomonas ginsengisoli An et al. 2013]
MAFVATLAFVSAAPAAAQSVAYNANPTTAFTYGSGNDYLPANASVLTVGDNQAAVRFHQTGQQALASDNGVYSFALGTSNISFDYGLSGFTDANVLLTNLTTGGTASFNTLLLGDANGALPGIQQSEQLGFGFLNGGFFNLGNINFDPNANATYRLDLTAGGNTLTSFAQVGTGSVAAVPEPSTWALMLFGFGGMGVAMRRQRRGSALLAQAA